MTEAQRDAAEAADELADFEDPERDLSSADYLRLVSRAQSIASDARVLSGHPLNTRENSSVVIDDAEKFSTVSLVRWGCPTYRLHFFWCMSGITII